MGTPPNGYVSIRKEAPEQYFPDFLALLAPWLHEHIFGADPPVFLNERPQSNACEAAI